MKRAKFCFSFLRKSGISYALFSNIAKGQKVDFLKTTDYFGSNPFLKGLNKIKKNFFDKPNLCFKKYKGRIVFMTNETISCLTDDALKRIKNESSAMVLFFIDEFFNDYESMSRAKELFFRYRDYFDLAYTFSKKDAIEYGLTWCTSYYDKIPTNLSAKEKTDVFFIGNMKKRENVLKGIKNVLSSKDVITRFVVPDAKIDDGFIRRPMLYKDCIKELQASNCVLDIPDEKQSGMTLRYYEAIVYNKKLITTNINVKDTPYYDERFMKIIKSSEDVKNVDSNWFKSTNEVDYRYRGEYETSNLLKEMEKKFLLK